MSKKRAVTILVALPLLIGWGYFGWIYSQDKTLEWGGMSRKYRLHRPLGDFDGEKRPLVVALHGYGDHPWFMEVYTGWSAKADREKFFVVYPYGTAGSKDANLSWNGGSCCGVALAEGEDDVGFVNNLITHLDKKYSIDLSRVYIVGFSNGALLTFRMSVETPKVAAKMAAVAGSVEGRYKNSSYFRLPNPKSSVNMMMVHGQKDTAVPYRGGVNWAKVAEFAAYSQTVKFWAAANICDPLPQQEKQGKAKIANYHCEGADLKTVEIENLGHAWPGGLLEWLSTGRLGDFSATDAMWEFFTTTDRLPDGV